MGKRGGKKATSAVTATQEPVRAAAPPTAANDAAAKQPSFPSVAQRSAEQAPGNVAVSWKPVGNGAGELYLAYEGPLAAAAGDLQARTGTRRAGGQAWAEARDVRLTREGAGRYVGVITVPTGAPVEAIELAFHAGEAWDNGGHAPLGFYEWTAQEQRVEAR